MSSPDLFGPATTSSESNRSLGPLSYLVFVLILPQHLYQRYCDFFLRTTTLQTLCHSRFFSGVLGIYRQFHYLFSWGVNPGANQSNHQSLLIYLSLVNPMASQEDHFEDYKRLGEYKVIKNLGEGSFGNVKCKRNLSCQQRYHLNDSADVTVAIHTLTDQKVALKYFSKARIKNLKLGARVTREIQYLRLLDHPHIVKM